MAAGSAGANCFGVEPTVVQQMTKSLFTNNCTYCSTLLAHFLHSVELDAARLCTLLATTAFDKFPADLSSCRLKVQHEHVSVSGG